VRDNIHSRDLIACFDEVFRAPRVAEADFDDPRILNRHGISATTTFESNIFMINKAFKSKGYN